jgi:hypothetical protein
MGIHLEPYVISLGPRGEAVQPKLEVPCLILIMSAVSKLRVRLWLACLSSYLLLLLATYFSSNLARPGDALHVIGPWAVGGTVVSLVGLIAAWLIGGWRRPQVG